MVSQLVVVDRMIIECYRSLKENIKPRQIAIR